MNQNLLDGARRVSKTIQDKNAEIKRLEIANAQLVKQYGELQHKYSIVSTLMRRFARMRTLDRWSSRMRASQVDGVEPPRFRTMAEWDAFNAALINKPWEDVTDL
jgi:hypothetical protein